MPRSRRSLDTRSLVVELKAFLSEFSVSLERDDLRERVRKLIPAFESLRNIGASLLPVEGRDAAIQRLLAYLRRYPRCVVAGKELLVVSGIGEWARRLRQLRTEQGWPIASGVTVRAMLAEGELDELGIEPTDVLVDDYVLLSDVQDREAAHRWHDANSVRRGGGSIKDRVLKYLRLNVGRPVTGEELMYVAKSGTEWARRVRELRTEEGWPVVTKNTGRPDLGIGVYLLEKDRQLPAHDRHIPDAVRAAVLRRDHSRCVECKWEHAQWHPADPRNLELHHVEHHVSGGANTAENLVTLCNRCHDGVHARSRQRNDAN